MYHKKQIKTIRIRPVNCKCVNQQVLQLKTVKQINLCNV